jgi:hypothetical protein
LAGSDVRVSPRYRPGNVKAATRRKEFPEPSNPNLLTVAGMMLNRSDVISEMPACT